MENIEKNFISKGDLIAQGARPLEQFSGYLIFGGKIYEPTIRTKIIVHKDKSVTGGNPTHYQIRNLPLEDSV